MGSFADLSFSNYSVHDTKNYLDQWLFKDSDKCVFKRSLLGDEEISETDLHEDDVQTAYTFETTVTTMIKRLEILGYTMEDCKNDFELRVNDELKSIGDIEEYDPEQAEAIKSIYSQFGDVEDWVCAFKIIIKDNVSYYNNFVDENYERNSFKHENELINYMFHSFSDWDDTHPIGFNYPCLDFNRFCRVLLEACEKDSKVVLDATDLVLGGWYSGFEHLEDIVKPHTRFYEVFIESISDIESLIEEGKQLRRQNLLSKLLYANAITALETYLSDTFIYTVVNFPPLIRRIVESDPEFVKRKIEVKDLFRRHDTIKAEVATYLEGIIFHKISKINNLYKSVLHVEFPNDLSKIYRAINTRHDIVHRNGRNKIGNTHAIEPSTVIELINLMKIFVDNVDLQVKNVYPKTLEGDF